MYDANAEYYYDTLGFTSSSEFGISLNTQYTRVIDSIDSYGGFYVGRYEASSSYGSSSGATVLASANWYTMYLNLNSTLNSSNPYYDVDSVASTMIWGSEYDQMLNFVLTGDDASKITTTISGGSTVKTSGQNSSDVMSNIYDLAANVYEWTVEANSYQYRVQRGGSYTTSSTASARKGVLPIDAGPALGTRVALYVTGTNDETAPNITTIDAETTSNTITVNVTAQDKETGISKYIYYIATSEKDLETASAKETTTSNTYTFTGLSPSTPYYIKVEAVDGNGNIGEATKGVETTELGAIAAENISVTSKYSSDGAGIVILELSEEYSTYYIAFNINAEVTDKEDNGNIVSGLYNGDTIYAIVTDGTNSSSDYFEYEVTGLEEFAYLCSDGTTTTTEAVLGAGTSYDTTVEYDDGAGGIAYIPAGFKVGVSDSVKYVSEGLVIQDEDGNQYVWVPVETAIEESSSDKAMARYQYDYDSGSLYNSSSNHQYFEGITYTISGKATTKRSSSYIVGKSNGYREPSLITGGADYTWNVSFNSALASAWDTIESYYRYFGFGTSTTYDYRI